MVLVNAVRALLAAAVVVFVMVNLATTRYNEKIKSNN